MRFQVESASPGQWYVVDTATQQVVLTTSNYWLAYHAAERRNGRKALHSQR